MYSYLSVPRGDTGYFFNTAYLPDGALNKGNYSNTKVTQLIKRIKYYFQDKQRGQVTNEILNESKKIFLTAISHTTLK